MDDVSGLKSFIPNYSQRTKKLQNFFGTRDVFIDVSILDIEKHGLKVLLQSKVPLTYFLYRLLTLHCSENLFFLLECAYYETIDTAIERKVAAQHICHMYLDLNSELQVNIDDKLRVDIMQSLKTKSVKQDLFFEAKRAIMILLEVPFMEFIKSELFRDMKLVKCRDARFTVKTRSEAVKMLTSYLDNAITLTNEDYRSRFLLMEMMIEEFSKKILFMDLDGSVYGDFGCAEFDSDKLNFRKNSVLKRVFG